MILAVSRSGAEPEAGGWLAQARKGMAGELVELWYLQLKIALPLAKLNCSLSGSAARFSVRIEHATVHSRRLSQWRRSIHRPDLTGLLATKMAAGKKE